MKNSAIVFAAAAALALTACNSRPADSTTANEDEVQTEETVKTPEKEANYAPMAVDGKVVELTNASTYAPGVKVPQLTILDFNAVWCGPCRQLAPVLEELAIKYEGRVTFVSVDVDKLGELFDAYSMGNAIPAILFLYPDGSQERYIGTDELLPGNKFEALIDAALAK